MLVLCLWSEAYHSREGGIEGGRGAAGRSSPTEAQRSVEEEDDKEGGGGRGGSPRGVYRSPQESRAALNRNSERERERESRVRCSNYLYWGASLCIAYAMLTLC